MDWTADSTGNNINYTLTSNTATTDTITFDKLGLATTTLAGYFKPDWLPESCKREKYLPTWHLVRSYEC